MVKRYKFNCDTYFDIYEAEAEDGSHVRHEDYAVLEARCAELDAELKELKAKLEKVYEAGLNGIHYVGSANYRSRQEEAIQNLDNVYDAESALKSEG